MTWFHPDWIAGERQRLTRHDAHLFVRPDWRRFLKPGCESEHLYAFIEWKAGHDRQRRIERSVYEREHNAGHMSR